jgi:hypothetical protein
VSARTIAPDQRRLREATRAGIRRSSVWLGRGFLCLALAAGLSAIGPRLLALAELDLAAAPEVAFASLLRAGGLFLVVLVGVAAALRVVAVGLSGGLGPVDSRLSRRFRGVDERRGAPLVVLALVVLGLSVAIHRGVLAGASRGVDASAVGLRELWTGWGAGVLAVAGALLVVFGVVELLLDELDRRRALRLSPEEHREALRERQGAAARR